MQEQYTLEEWIGMLEEAGYDTNDMDEGKLSRLAAGLGLAGAAMMGGAKDAGAQTVANAPATQDVRGVVSPADSAKMVGQAGIEAGKQFSDMSNYLRTAQAGRQGGLRVVPGDSAKFVQQAQDDKATQIGVHNYAQRVQGQRPGGLQFKATNPITKESQHKKRYSLEEWLGALEEAGYDLEEGFMDTLRSAGRQVRDTAKGAGRLAGAVGAAALGGDARSAARYIGSDMKTAYNTGAAVGRGADTKYEPGRQDIGHTGQKGSVGAGIKNVFRNVRKYGQQDKGPDYADITKAARSGELKKYADREIEGNKDPLAYRHYEPSESYTLEEWMGMLEEAGYDISEYSLWRPKESGAKSTGVMKDPKKPKTPPAEPTKPKKKLDELSPEFKANYATAAADRANKIAAAANAGTMDKSTAHKKLDKTAKALRTADNATINKYGADKQNATIQQARTQVRDAGQTIREEKETINENTVSRLQQLAGITPTE